MKSFTILHLASILMLLFSCSPENPWVITEDSNGLSIAEGQDSVLYYQKTVKSLDGEYPRSNYIHPLYDLAGNVITEDFPEDHLHHRGIFWTWHQVFIGDQRIGDGWAIENMKWDVDQVSATGYPDSCVLKTNVFWESPNWTNSDGKSVPFVKETAKVTIYPESGNSRILDFEIQIEALVDSLYLGGSEDPKGYSGFSYRIKLPEDVQFEAKSGIVTPQTLALDLGPWVAMQGDLTGSGTQEGVAVISHPSNPNHPQPWILRAQKSMQNVKFPGREKVMIPRDHPLNLRYRMILYEGTLDSTLLKW